MKAKKLISVLLCMIMIFALAVPAFAAKSTTTTFSDTSGNWAEHEIYLVADAGIVGGYPDGSFRPTANITRGAFAKIVSNFMGYTEGVSLEQFPDIVAGGTFNDYIARCVKNGVMGGYPDGTMRPNADITREQAAAMLRRAFKLNTEGVSCNFVDSDLITSSIRNEVAALELTGLITGYTDGTFRPKDNLKREQMMKIISRLLPDNEGYFVRVNANSGDVAMTFDMMDDYTSAMFIPAGDITADKIDLIIDIDKIPALNINVSSLGVGHIEDTVSTGLSGNVFNPKTLFPSVYGFNFATLKISVNDMPCTYNVYGRDMDNGTTMIMTPTDSNGANDGMKQIMNLSNILIDIFTYGNSITVANGSYLQVGTEKICFPEDSEGDLEIDLASSDAEATELVFSTLTTMTDVPTDGHQATLVVKKGTAYTTDKATIKLNKDLTVTFDGLDLSDTGIDGEHLITTLENADLSNLEMLIQLANNLVYAMDGNVAYINVTLER